ncbi:MAG: hypothetical protein ACLFQB_10505 [Chitinispirillaceae bacterium]
MAQTNEAREKLVSFLDRHVFDPIINTSEDRFSNEREKSKFRDVLKSTKSEKSRFHERYPTARDVKKNYLSDLNSRTAQKKNAELRELHLPQLPQFKEEFLDLCDRLGV